MNLSETPSPSSAERPSLLIAVIPLLVLIGLLILNIRLFHDSATLGANQIALAISASVAAVLGISKLKVPYDKVEAQVIRSIGMSMQAILILLVVGSLIGLWILAGVVPALIYYGIDWVSPGWFLPVVCLICSLVSMATGSSWSTGGTVGIALMGIGKAMGIPDGMIAGAIISGSYFGDKLSPLSDTTNLAPAMAGTDLFTHVRYMLYTTLPSLLIALMGYFVLGLQFSGTGVDLSSVEQIRGALSSSFVITPWSLLLPLLVIVMVAKKMPALPALLIGAALGGLFALGVQQDLLARLTGGEFSPASGWKKILEVTYGGFKLETGVTAVDSLLSRGGMGSMLNTVWLILMAMTFGGVMEVTGMLERVAQAILSLVRGTGSLVAATIASCITINVTAADQYLSIVVPGRMFKSAYEKAGLAPENLSRSLEDAGTLTSVLVPWNTCGAYFAGILGVSTFAYFPYAFLNLVNPIVAIVIATVGFRIRKLKVSSSQ